jgi:sialic acid synthase SpsE
MELFFNNFKNEDYRMIRIGHRNIGPGNPCFIIAEIGTSHGGSIDKARGLIRAAKAAGADCVKFQLVFAREILHPNVGSVELPGGKIDLFSRFETLERDTSFYMALKEAAESENIEFLCTPFGIGSARILKSMSVKAIKIASPETNHYPLLEEVAGFGIPVIASTGVTTAGDIERMLSILGKNTALLHCITSYPAPEEEYNIRIIPNLSRLFRVAVGVSDHSLDPVLVPVLSVLTGGCIIEKHFTAQKSGDGLDDPIALDPKGFELMVARVRKAENEDKARVLGIMEEEFGKTRVAKVMGTGAKELSRSEMGNYLTTKRSVLALTDIQEFELFTEQNTAILRSEKNLRPGLKPEFHHLIIGKPSRNHIRAGYGVTWDDVI